MRATDGIIKTKRKIDSVEVLISIFLGIITLVCIFPIYNVIIVSFANFEAISRHPVYFLPYTFDLSAYGVILSGNSIFHSFLVSLFVTVVGTLLSMTLSILAAYALSKRTLPGRKFILGAIILTMYFSGGLIPYYLVVKGVGLVDNILVMMIPTAINTFYLILMKNYFNSFPASLEESAKIDGANDLYILVKIVIPISAPIIATFTLFYSVDRWNEWWHALLFISDINKTPLQIVLRQILINFDMAAGTEMGKAILRSKKPVYADSVRMAIVVITSVPIAIVYPFLQRHFTKGIIVGSLKA